ncbi:MAG: 2Fe-2S iron-sulfur cluster-binding protein, partial [Acidimicrobiia bacterium]
MAISLRVDGRDVSVADDGASLLEVLRDRLGAHSPKDGCSPQGQCGCCTVLVDGQPRVACVTPARRVAGRTVTTLDGFPDDERRAWAEAFTAAGASQCGFCTPGIVVRLAALAASGGADVDTALLAHLCRCTGWLGVKEAFARHRSPAPAAPRDLDAARRRATLEGGAAQDVGPHVALGGGGFADDTAPADALVAVPDGRGGWAVAETLTEARARAGKVQGRRTTLALSHPLAPPPGDWALTLRTTWVEPAYLEPDASWCEPGGEPASPLANGGAFGGKVASVAPAAARRLADEHGRAVRVLLSREDVVRTGPKRPPVAGGVRPDGSGVLRVARTPGVAAAVAAVAPDLAVEEVDVAGPPTSACVRAAGWAEAAVLVAAARGGAAVAAPSGGRAEAEV